MIIVIGKFEAAQIQLQTEIRRLETENILLQVNTWIY